MDSYGFPLELRVSTDPIIQVYSNKVDITENLNVAGDITFTGNLYDANGIFTSGGGGSGGTTYDDANRLNYEFLRVPTEEGESFVNIQEPIITQDANIQESTSSPSVTKTTINSDYKYMSFSNIITPDINYNFTSQNTLANWKTYADTIPNATYDFSHYDAGYDGVWFGFANEGFFQIILPATHDYLEITWGNALNRPAGQPTATTSLTINGTVVDSITDIIQSKQYI